MSMMFKHSIVMLCAVIVCASLLVSSYGLKKTSSTAVRISRDFWSSSLFGTKVYTAARDQPVIQAALASVLLSVLLAMPSGANAKPGDIAPTDKDNLINGSSKSKCHC